MSSQSSDPEKEIGLRTTNDDGFVLIGRTKVPVNDVLNAFGGNFNPGLSAPPKHDFANPSPLGLSGFALTTFVLSIINFNGRGLQSAGVVVPIAYFYGGVVQLLAGMWEMAVGNTFAATALSSYGGFWLCWAAIETPAFGVAAAYEEDSKQVGNAVGFFMLGWVIFTFGILICTIRSTVAFCGMFIILELTFLMLDIGLFTGSKGCTKAGGVLGLITSLFAWYNAYAGVATKENTYLIPRAIYLPGAHVIKPKSN